MNKEHIADRNGQNTEGVAKAEKGETAEEGKTKRFDLSVAQVMGSTVAAVVAAFLAGKLNVYGTFLGAGVVSLVATSGGPIFQHFFRRTGEQIKEVAVPPKAKGRPLPLRDPAAGWKDESGLDATQAMRGTGQVPGAEPSQEDQATRLLRTASPARPAASAPPGEAGQGGGTGGEAGRSPDQVQMLDTSMVTRMLPGARAEGVASSTAHADAEAAGAVDDATRVLGTVDRPEEARVPAEKLPADGEFTGGTTHGTRWRGWKRTLLPAVVVFVIAIGGITLYEAISGHNVSGGKGTSISDVFRPGGGSSGDSPDAPPATPTPGQSEDGGDGSTGDEDGSDGPSSSPGTDSGEHGGKGETGTGSNETDGSTPSPEQSTPQRPGGSDEPTTDPGSTSDPSGSDERQEDTGESDGGAGSGRFPQRQQSEPSAG